MMVGLGNLCPHSALLLTLPSTGFSRETGVFRARSCPCVCVTLRFISPFHLQVIEVDTCSPFARGCRYRSSSSLGSLHTSR
uniref:Putative secreted protein n=1 Tax=Anopheles darlingi TaxID=43151 RepID=A0A2M4D7N9_ANODA